MDFQTTNQEFIKNILLKVGFEDNEGLPVLIDQTLTTFSDRLESEILTALSDDDMERFDKLVDLDPSDEQIYDFFNSSIKDFDSFMEGLYQKFEKTYITQYNKSLNK